MRRAGRASVVTVIIDVTTPDGTVEAWLARPAHMEPSSPMPGVLLLMDAIGLRPRIHDMADRIASWGYTVLAPNLFHRNGTAAETSPTGPLETDEARAAFFEHAGPRVRALTPELFAQDLPAYLAALGSHAATAPFGVVGYCMGARHATRAACTHPDVIRAVGGFHGGGLATDGPDSPHLGLPHARAEFVYGHADHDRSMDTAAVARLGAALDAAGLVASNEIYPGAAHGYTMADTSVYDEAATERHFTALRDLFDRTLH